MKKPSDGARQAIIQNARVNLSGIHQRIAELETVAARLRRELDAAVDAGGPITRPSNRIGKLAGDLRELLQEVA